MLTDTVLLPDNDGDVIHGDGQRLLKVYCSGILTVVGFGGATSVATDNLVKYRDELRELIRDNSTEQLVFDFTGIEFVPSGMIGLMLSLHKEGIELSIYNASADIRDVLEVTGVDRFLTLREIDFSD